MRKALFWLIYAVAGLALGLGVIAIIGEIAKNALRTHGANQLQQTVHDGSSQE